MVAAGSLLSLGRGERASQALWAGAGQVRGEDWKLPFREEAVGKVPSAGDQMNGGVIDNVPNLSLST